jgi:hypothetical protein
MTDEVRKLLGGYATGTLTDTEKEALYDAALHDQDLFEVLANEQALKELLDDPSARAQVLQATETHGFSVWAVLREWFDRPRSKALVATGAVVLVAIAINSVRHGQVRQSATVKLEQPSLIMSPPPAAPPSKPEPVEKKIARRTSSPKRETASQPVMTAAGPPAGVQDSLSQEPMAAPDVLTKVATSGKTELRYALTKRTPVGFFEPVPLDATLGVSDEARLTVQANERGMIMLAADKGTPVSSAVTEPGRTITLAVPFGAESIVLSFVRSPQRLVANTLVQPTQSYQASEARAKTAGQGVFAGAPRSEAVEVESNARLARAGDEPRPQISVEIKLNRSQPR